MPLLKLRDVNRIYDNQNNCVQALKDINLEIPRGKIVVIKGPSGSGKTTILNLMAGLDKPSSGDIIFKGRNLNNLPESALTVLRRKEIGIIFQDSGLIEDLTAYENVELPLRLNYFSWQKRKQLVNDGLKMVGLEKRLNHRVFELSGGEQQRIGIARAMVARPSLLLADEPTSEIDVKASRQILTLFKETIEKYKITICMVTHDPIALDYADIVYEILDGEIAGDKSK